MGYIKNITVLVLSTMLVFCLAGCSTNKERIEKTLIFRGESKNWQAEYTVKTVEVWEEKDKLHYSNEMTDNFMLQYKTLI